MKEEVIYIHYGDAFYDENKFIQPSNMEDWPKPKGGLWASRLNAEYGWKEWCEAEDFNQSKLMYNFKFTINKNAKVLLIRRLKDISKHAIKNNNIDLYSDALHCPISMIDFEHIMRDGYDAIELIHGDNYMELHNGIFHIWDCDSILILNKDIIEPITGSL